MEVFIGNIGTSLAKLNFNPDRNSPQTVSNDFCRSHLSDYVHKFVNSETVTFDGVAPENKQYIITEVDINGCVEAFTSHITRMMVESIHFESNEELRNLNLKIYE